MNISEGIEPQAPTDKNTKLHFHWFDKCIAKDYTEEEEVIEERTFIESICIENDLKKHFPTGTTKFKDLLYDKLIITFDELKNYEDGEV